MKTKKARHGARAAVLVLLAAGLLGACATTEPIWFIATPGYVESQIAASESSTRQDYELQLAMLEAEVANQREAAAELAALAEVVREIEATNRELLDLAGVVEGRLASLPEETIRQIVDVLQAYLDGPQTDP